MDYCGLGNLITEKDFQHSKMVHQSINISSEEYCFFPLIQYSFAHSNPRNNTRLMSTYVTAVAWHWPQIFCASVFHK